MDPWRNTHGTAAVADVPFAWTVRPFGLEDVSLGQGVFADKRQLMLDHARGYDGNRLGIGGTSIAEFWKARDVIAGTIGAATAETCCAYNMRKLSRTLSFHEQEPKYMEYYERALYNQVLGSKQDEPDAEKPLVTYFIGLTPGHVRHYTPK